MKKKSYLYFSVFLIMLLFVYQNCSKVGFSKSESGDPAVVTQSGGPQNSREPEDTTDKLFTDENIILFGQTASVQNELKLSSPSEFTVFTTPSSGHLEIINNITGTFSYEPHTHFFGFDRFQLVEENPAIKRKVLRTILIQVNRTGQPFILSDVFNFNINTTNNFFEVEIGDNEVPDPWVDLSTDGSVGEMKTKNGTLVKKDKGFLYTPDFDYRGTDEVLFYARDSKGGLSSRKIKLMTGNPLIDIQPGMAVRGSNCIQCHAQIRSNFITDFGYGDSYYFAHDKPSAVSGDWIYSLRLASDATKKLYFPDWITSAAFANGAQLIVPKADLGFKYADLAPSFVDKTDMTSWLYATTIADLMTRIQSIPDATFKAPVVEKESIYIGAPSIAEIKSAGKLDSTHPYQYWKNSDISYDLSGLALSTNGQYYTNTDTLVCDGDLFIDGTLFLNQPVIKTINGCRIHATGVIFMQKGITYVTDSTLPTQANLQLVSSRAISIGVGLSHCEAQTDPSGWYNVSKVANPLDKRFNNLVVSNHAITRNTDPNSHFPLTSSTPALEGQYIVNEAKKIPDIEDSSCHGRNLSFERLLLVAPQIHSRYKGNFSGVIIGEIPLFALGKFIFQFDPTFLKVPVLPLINMDHILKVK